MKSLIFPYLTTLLILTALTGWLMNMEQLVEWEFESETKYSENAYYIAT
jgi:hypothetical protein